MSNHSVKSENIYVPRRVHSVGMILNVDFNPTDPASWRGMLWFAWAVAWVLTAFTTKRTRTREPILSRILFLIPIVLGAMLLFVPQFRTPALTTRFVPR